VKPLEPSPEAEKTNYPLPNEKILFIYVEDVDSTIGSK
jgi:hypothetical protein